MFSVSGFVEEATDALSYPFSRRPCTSLHDNTNTAFDKDFVDVLDVANGAVEEFAADVYDIRYGYQGLRPTLTASLYNSVTRRC
jgi:hypothetical protein